MKKDFKVVIAGTRTFDDYELLKSKMDAILCRKAKQHNIIIVSGTAKGADTLGELYAQECGYDIKRFPANWDKYGKRAGFLRNEEMGKYADVIVIFWDGFSKGAKLMVDIAKRLKKPLRVVMY